MVNVVGTLGKSKLNKTGWLGRSTKLVGGGLRPKNPVDLFNINVYDCLVVETALVPKFFYAQAQAHTS